MKRTSAFISLNSRYEHHLPEDDYRETLETICFELH